MAIPPGRIEVQLSDDSATLSWQAQPGVVGLAAMPRTQFDEHLQASRIRWLPD